MRIISSRTGFMAPTGTRGGERADMSGLSLNIMARSNRVRSWYIFGRLLTHVWSLRLQWARKGANAKYNDAKQYTCVTELVNGINIFEVTC